MSERDSYGNLKDNQGLIYQTPDNKPADYGTQVKISDGNGGHTTGTMIYGTVVKNTN